MANNKTPETNSSHKDGIRTLVTASNRHYFFIRRCEHFPTEIEKRYVMSSNFIFELNNLHRSTIKVKYEIAFGIIVFLSLLKNFCILKWKYSVSRLSSIVMPSLSCNQFSQIVYQSTIAGRRLSTPSRCHHRFVSISISNNFIFSSSFLLLLFFLYIFHIAIHTFKLSHDYKNRAHMKLTIKHLQYGDFGNYRCISKNSLGETEGSIRVYGKWEI